jgi:hypothetical protein
MKFANFVNGLLTVVLDDGTLCTKSGMTREDYFKIIELSDTDIKKEMRPNLLKEEVKQIEKKRLLSTIDDMVRQTGLFTKVGDAVYRNGINLSIPELLALELCKVYNQWIDDSFDEVFENYPEFQKLDNFWMWLSLNPNEESRNDLFRFLNTHQMSITSEGMVLAYRRVYATNTVNKEIISFVSNQWIKVKTVWKKKPSDYEVFKKNGEYFITSKSADKVDYDSHTGNLDSLYKNLEQFGESQFTDAHTRSFNYKIGVENRMERHQGNQSNQVSCSKG